MTRNARKWMRDTQAIHRTLGHIFDKQKILWSTPATDVLVVQHDGTIDWGNELENCVKIAQTVETKTPTTGVPVRFAIIANPVVTKTDANGKKKKYGLPADQNDGWIRRKLDGAINISESSSQVLPVARGKRHEMKTIHHRVLFDGYGTVADQEKLQQLQNDGIGRGKAYGCGLLLVQEAV